MRVDAPIARRTFLRVADTSAGLAALSRLRFAAPLGAVEPGTLHVLEGSDARILGALAERMVFTGDPQMPRFADTAGLATIDAALLQVPEAVRTQLHYGLQMFQYGPPVLTTRFSTFTGLDEAGQDEYLHAWEDSRFAFLRVGFQAFKNLAYLGYYADDTTWQGIHYDGPWVPRPRRKVEA